jgi:hypothetical protein
MVGVYMLSNGMGLAGLVDSGSDSGSRLVTWSVGTGVLIGD